MKGLLINNYYAVRTNAKVFSGFMLLLGLFAAAVISQSLLIGYIFLAVIGFSVNMSSSLRKEFVSKWGKYKLTAPIRRSDIVKSHFISQLIWLFVGMVFAGAVVALSWLLHGFPFDRNTDILFLFTAGVGISLLMGAIFFPLFYLTGEERSEVVLGISLLVAVLIFMGLVSLINLYFGPEPAAWQVITSAFILLSCSAAVFVLSYPLTVAIFRKNEY